jgi:hypothetical protein
MTGFLAVVTTFWHAWIEAFGFDPDHGDGSAEWTVVVVLAAVCVVSSVLARVEWRRPRPAGPAARPPTHARSR